MSLYDDLDKDEDEAEKKTAWGANLKLLQSHIQLKKAALTQQRDKPRVPNFPTDQSKKIKSIVVNEPIYISTKERNALFEDLQVQDEYNPLVPNDYEKLAKRRDEERQRRRAEEKKVASENRERRKREKKELKGRGSEDEDSDDDWKREKEKRMAGAAIAPPPSLTTSTNDAGGGRTEESESTTSSGFAKPRASTGRGLNVAAKIMEKYGYRQGGGLGKQEQGMSTALQVEKTGLRGGKIIHEKDTLRDIFLQPPPPVFSSSEQQQQTQEDNGPSITEMLKNPTKVVLLRNMIGPGEVDDDLDGEIREEMSKYGDVTNVVIFEIPGAPAEEAVRIFVEYPKVDQSIKALVGLNGRFFNGKSIRATFYTYDKYKRFELGD